MAPKRSVTLHRDDPDKPVMAGHIKVTREDWLNAAREVLVNHGVAEVKILLLSERLGVSRSSFYWYFGNRKDLLAALLEEWERKNTASIEHHCAKAAESITEAICNFFLCFVQPGLFDDRLDFAVREWSRRDPEIRQRIDAADTLRLKAVTGMFLNHGYDQTDAYVRARILYFMQLGYHALEVREPMSLRLSRIEAYIRGFSGQEPALAAVEAFREHVVGSQGD